MQSKHIITGEALMDMFKYPHKYAIHPFRIAGNLFYVGNTSVSSHLIDTGDGLIIIDTTYPHTYPLLINSIWEAGFSIYDIKYILHTHGHFDHFGGTSELAALTNAKTFLGERDARMFRERPELTLGTDCPFCYIELFTPDVEIKDGQIITLGNTEIRAVSTPGHSPGVISFIIKVTDGGTIYTAAMQGGAGLNTLNLPFLQGFNLDVSETRNDFLEGIKKLESETVDITLGNHPKQNKTVEKRQKMLENPDAPNPFIDPTEWRMFLSDIKNRFNAMLGEEAEAEKG
jgi:metallo-beta-lactamase class B